MLRKKPEFRELLAEKMSLGAGVVRDLGNLYSAALPAWLAAGFEEGAEQGLELVGAPDGRGRLRQRRRRRGDADHAGARLGAGRAAHPAQAGARARRSTSPASNTRRCTTAAKCPGLDYAPQSEFVITHVGERYDPAFQDLGVEYYEYVG